MTIEWNPSRGATLGVEWEVQLIDSESRMLRQEAGKLLAELPVIGDTGEHPQITFTSTSWPATATGGCCAGRSPPAAPAPRRNWSSPRPAPMTMAC